MQSGHLLGLEEPRCGGILRIEVARERVFEDVTRRCVGSHS